MPALLKAAPQAEGSDRLLDHRLDLTSVSHVAGDGKGLVARRAQPISGRLDQRRVPICDYHGGASFSEGAGRGETNTAAGSGNERNLSFKQRLHG